MAISKKRAIEKYALDLVRDYVYEGSLKVDNLSTNDQYKFAALILDERNCLDCLDEKETLSLLIERLHGELSRSLFSDEFLDMVTVYYKDAMQNYLDEALEEWEQRQKEKDPDDY